MQTERDITGSARAEERVQQAEASLQRRLAIEELVGRISGRFVRMPVGRTGVAIDAALADLGRFLGADDARVQRFDDDHTGVVTTHAWHREGAPEPPPSGGRTPVDGMSEHSRAVLDGERMLIVRSSDELPEDATPERDALAAAGLGALCAMPLVVAGEARGLLTLDTVGRAHDWPEDAAEVVQAVGELLAAALERQDAQETVRRQEEAYRTLAEGTPDAIGRLDRAFHALNLNERGRRLTEDAPGGTARFSPEMHARWRAAVEQVFATGEPATVETATTGDGDGVHWYETRVVPERDESGDVRTVVFIARDVTEQRRVAERLRRSERALEAAQAQAQVGHWTFDPATGKASWSPEMMRIIGRAPSTSTMSELPLTGVVDADREVARDAIERALRGEAVGPIEVRILRPDGSVRVLAARVKIEHDLGEQGPIVLGTVQDVTDPVQVEEALRVSEARYRALLLAVPDLIMRLDDDGTILDVVAPPDLPLVAPPEQLLGHRLHEFVPSVADATLALGAEAHRTGAVQTLRYQLPELGSAQHFEGRIVPVGDHELLVIARDVTSEALSREQLEHAASHDALTGLPNRTLFLDRLGVALRAAARSEDTVALVLVDLDGFKAVNDLHGHVVGDAVLREAARRVAAAVRQGDTAARWGGDELVVLCTGLDGASRAGEIAERMVATLREPIALASGQTVALSASAGVALARADDDADTLLGRADQAMYAAKQAGKSGWHLEET